MKLFVLDFHGVLEKGTERAVLYFSNKALEELGYSQRFTQEQINDWYGLKWHQYFRNLMPGLEEGDYLALQNKCFELDTAQPDVAHQLIAPNDNSLNLLSSILRCGHDLILISNTNPEAMNRFLESTGHDKFFEKNKIFALDAHANSLKRTKCDILRQYLDSQLDKGVDYEDIIIIGDSPGDMELKTVAGGKAYLYTHPYLKQRSCVFDYSIHDLSAVLREV